MIRFAFIILFVIYYTTASSQNLANDSIFLDEFVYSVNKIEEPKKFISRQLVSIRKEKIEFLNQQTTADLLMQSGQVFIQKSQQGGGSPIIRGMEANRVLIVVDGIRLNNAIYRSGHLQNVIRIDQQMLQSAEVLFGPGSIMYGSDAMGGVMHFSTQNPLLNNKSGSVMYRIATANNESTLNLNLMQGFKKWGYIVNITSSRFGDLVQGKNRNQKIGDLGLRPFFSKRIDTADVVVANNNIHKQTGSAYSQVDMFGKILFEPNKKFRHILNLQYSTTGNVPRYDRLTEFENDKPVFSEWYYGPEVRTLASYQLTVLKPNILFDRAVFSTGYQYIEESRHTRNFNNPELRSRNEYVQVITQNTDFTKKISGNQLHYGSEIMYNYVHSFAVGKNIQTLSQRPISTRYPDGGSSYLSASLYAYDNVALSNKLNLNFGVRYNYIYLQSRFLNKTFYSFLPDNIRQINHAVNASVGSTFLIKKALKWYANVSNGFRAPNVDDVSKIFDSRPGDVLIIPNKNLKPEQCITTETGLNLTKNKINLDVNIFYTRLFNAIVVYPTGINGKSSVFYDDRLTPVFSNQNVQSAYITGFTGNLTVNLSRQLSFSSTINYTYGDILKPAYMPLDHIPPAFGRSAVLYRKKLFTGEFYTLYAGAKKLERYNLFGEDNLKYATANGLPGWQTYNVRISVRNKRQNLQLNAAVENVFDVNYRLFASGISAAGRNLIVSLRINL